MIDGEWRIVYDGVDYSFGAWGFPVFNATTPEPGSVDFSTGDASRPYEDGINFGLDSRSSGRTWSFDLGVVDLGSEALVRQRVREFLRAWRAPEVLGRAGKLAELHTQYAGQHRVMYGRPRQADPVYKNTSATLAASIQATFVTGDDVLYAPEVTSAETTLVSKDNGGWVFPIRFPVMTVGAADSSTVVRLDTELPAWPVITISGGQVLNPVVEAIPDAASSAAGARPWRVGLATNLAYDDVVVIDTRPWMRTVLRNGYSIAGALDSGSSRLANCGTGAGGWKITFNGASSTSTVKARIDWRSAYSGL